MVGGTAFFIALAAFFFFVYGRKKLAAKAVHLMTDDLVHPVEHSSRN